jgi:hypothetical protein
VPIEFPGKVEEVESLAAEMGSGVAKAGDARRAMRTIVLAEVERMLMDIRQSAVRLRR